ncbi:MAG: IS66 family transposase, partial [Methylococcales bacterium]
MSVATDAAIGPADSGVSAGLVWSHAEHQPDQPLHLPEAGRAVEPLEEQLVKDLRQEILSHGQIKRPGRNGGNCSAALGDQHLDRVPVFNRVAQRGTAEPGLRRKASQWQLMSDGYAVYRRFRKRLRCWAHLLRKAKFLEECLSVDAQSFGKECRVLLETLMEAIYQAREGLPLDLTPCYT